MNRGHYISLVKSHGLWLLFDDDNVDVSIYYFRTQVVLVWDHKPTGTHLNHVFQVLLLQ